MDFDAPPETEMDLGDYGFFSESKDSKEEEKKEEKKEEKSDK